MRLARQLILVSAVAALASAAPAAAKTPLKSTGNGIEVPGTATWPTTAVHLAKDVAKASFAHEYARVWSYLEPHYQNAVPQTRWARCQRAHPAARRVTHHAAPAAADVEQPHPGP